jgi:hypothetical protein
MSKGIDFIIPVLLLVAITPRVAHATNSLTAPYNAGFLGVPFKGHHTANFIAGYLNGTNSYWYNRGTVWGFNGLHPEYPQSKNYMTGYADGIDQKTNALGNPNNYKIPTTSDDDYMHYFIEYHDGAVKQDSDHDIGTYSETCPSGHTQEYYAGYSAGYNAENCVLAK